jgi:heme/copper-type cytochrome/quinol oxidase subunit 3
MTTRAAIDVSPLPTFAFGHRSILWWATLGLVVIEATAFALLIASYFFLRWRVPDWPPALAPPELLWGTVNTLLLLASAVPNELTKRAAERLDRPAVRLWIVASIASAVPVLIIRGLEFTALNCRWDTNAYGSVVWLLLGMHTAHLITDWMDTVVLAAMVFAGHDEGRRLVDVSENALYWYFIVLSWLPVYAVIYIAPRVL